MKRNSYYPVFLKIQGRLCVVVGGGTVALRKVNTLVKRGAPVTVVSPSLCPGLARLAELEKIKVISREFRPEDIDGAFLVIAATNKGEINERVAAFARKKQVLVNIADNAGMSDFILPAILDRGDLSIAISTSGKSPALSSKIRDVLEELFRNEYASLVELTAEVRSKTKRGGNQWSKALDLELLTSLLRKGQREQARAVLLSNLDIEK